MLYTGIINLVYYRPRHFYILFILAAKAGHLQIIQKHVLTLDAFEMKGLKKILRVF